MRLYDAIYNDVYEVSTNKACFEYDVSQYDDHALLDTLKITIENDLITIVYKDLKLYARYYADDILMTMRAIEYAFIAYEYENYRISV